MPEPAQTLDVQIVDTMTIYQKVPYTVVGDWIQQGRLLPDDQVRLSGSPVWGRLADSPLLAPYLPKPVPFRANDEAEAMEPVELDFPYRSAPDTEEEVDMVPLIDVSLVLLIFFMMTTSGLMAVSLFNMPEAKHAQTINAPDKRNLGVVPAGSQIWRVMVENGESEPVEIGYNSSRRLEYVKGKIDTIANECKKSKEIFVKADPSTPFEVIEKLTFDLDMLGVKALRAGVKHKGGGQEP